ncbi:TPM domain-containing protein [Flavivirga algicola]|uniref:TPM domain-containing protein n=1 Tax=Flavivirga algicola TaxID=2729136 RepID=A0ABX1S206_9FLAO|nr:TPM domain-containing protein [Flavivirga algicola]NMH89892.1 TPM domain-containing protein [Flavivirga algicola]
MRRLFLYLVIFLTLISCKKNENSKHENSKVEIIFSEDINKYNYLDKPHDLMFVYDFDTLFLKNQLDNLKDNILKLKEDQNLTFIVVTDAKPKKKTIVESAKITNGIFNSKYNLDKVVTFKISKASREVGIAYSRNLESKLNDSICNMVIKDILVPSFKNKEYYNGVNLSINSLVNYINSN